LARFGRQSARAAADFIERNRALDAGSFAVTAFTLFESRLSRHGPHYQEVATYALG
jgi:2'-5' RNA ligase